MKLLLLASIIVLALHPLASAQPFIQTETPDFTALPIPSDESIGPEVSFAPFPSRSPPRIISPCPTILPLPSEPLSRVVGGSAAALPSARHMAALYEFDFPVCSATLLSPRWVITAAHCIRNPRSPPGRGSNYTVRVGARDWDEESVRNPVIPVIDIYTAPRQLLRPDLYYDADVALLRLARPIPSAFTFARVNANDSVPAPYAFARAVGYGRSSFDDFATVGVLRQVDLPTVPKEECINSYWYTTDKNLCTGYPTTECGVCQGDSGGALLQYDPEGNPVLIGIPSRTVGCGSLGFYDGHMHVSRFTSWMKSVGAEFETNLNAVQVFAPVQLPTTDPVESPEACPVVLPHLPARTPFAIPASARVTGGSEASSISARFMVALWDRSFLECSGVMLSRTWVLTAASCDVEYFWTVYIGGRHAFAGYLARIDSIYRGVDSSARFGSLLANVTLIRLQNSTLDTSGFALVNTAVSLPKTGAFARSLGYGREELFGQSQLDSRTLRQVEIPVSPNSACKGAHSTAVVTNTVLCTGYEEGGCGPCDGRDKGGPLLQFDTKGRPIVVGILISENSCGIPGRPGVFARISNFVSWMRSVGAVFETSDEAEQIFSDVKPDPLLIPSPSSF